MANGFAGWRKVHIEHGIRLVPPAPAEGVIQIRHHLRLRPVREIVEQIVETKLGGEAMALVAPPRKLTTVEGEYGARFDVAGPGIVRSIGLVYGDDAMTIIDGRAFGDSYTTLVDSLTIGLDLGLGTDRWRRFWYEPPAGWEGLERVRADVWLAPGFPKPDAMITVFHARPESKTALVQHYKLFEELTSEYGVRRSEPRPVQTRSGLEGHVVEFAGESRCATQALLGDGVYLYPLRLESTAALHADIFMRVIESVEALPLPKQQLGGVTHWSE